MTDQSARLLDCAEFSDFVREVIEALDSTTLGFGIEKVVTTLDGHNYHLSTGDVFIVTVKRADSGATS